MDDMDRKILAELQLNGRLSATDLGERIGLSLSPCHRRLRALEESKVISGYRANIDAASVGLSFSAIIFVTLRESTKESVAAIESAFERVPEITDAQRLFGDPDYLVRVVTRDLSSFQRLYDERLSALPSVLRLRSTLVMKSIFQNRPLPI